MESSSNIPPTSRNYSHWWLSKSHELFYASTCNQFVPHRPRPINSSPTLPAPQHLILRSNSGFTDKRINSHVLEGAKMHRPGIEPGAGRII